MYEQFKRLNPKGFSGTTDTFVAKGWIRSLEVHFRYLDMGDVDRDLFYGKYFTAEVRGRLIREFISLRQGDTSVAEFIQKFDRGCHFVPLIARDAADMLRHFMDGLRPTIRIDFMLMRSIDYEAETSCAYQVEKALRDVDVEMQRKRHKSQQTS
ncbi:uncharacterized protein [Primulina eburnea]|uniref:uncharacterized protein n=1 Tax=Primulina eburnea TaxID=1245227 RepID=UPI003C6C975E